MPEVVELSNNLSALLFELPDPDEELFCQSPHTFWLFSKLPLEIRLNIWRQTFPRRTHIMFTGPYRCLTLRHTPAPPVSSQVNFESRQETLLHYKVPQLSTWCACSPVDPRSSTFTQRGTVSGFVNVFSTFAVEYKLKWIGVIGGFATSVRSSRSLRVLLDPWNCSGIAMNRSTR
jgi:hypothetical protein